MASVGKGLLAIAVLIGFVGCGGAMSDRSPTAQPAPTAAARTFTATAGDRHLRHFGFVGVDCFLDDPLDTGARINYTDEVAEFTTMAHFCAADPAEDVAPRLRRLRAHGLRAFFQLDNLLLDRVADTSAPNGVSRTFLKPDAERIWTDLVSHNRSTLDADHVAAISPVDEPTWQGLSPESLATLTRLVKRSLPDVPIAVVESYAALDALAIPTSVDWVGFDRYFVRDPGNDPAFLADLTRVKEARSRPDQRILLVLDSHYVSQHADAGIDQGEMADVGRSLLSLANVDPDVVAVIGYSWAGGLDGPDQLGARGLPTSVQETYRRAGRGLIRSGQFDLAR